MQAKLIKVVEESFKTKTFIFEPEKKVTFLPGQYFYFTLPELIAEDPRGQTRHFTLSNSPTEGSYIQFTTRISESGYKQTLDKYKIGQLVETTGPNGTFILDEKEVDTHLFLAGGIGITPFRSFIKYGLDKKLHKYYHLIYSDSNIDNMAFYDELKDLSTAKNFDFDITLTKPDNIWRGNTGRISKELIVILTRDKTDIKNCVTWLCGPPAFVNAMEDISMDLGIKDIRVEKFTGY